MREDDKPYEVGKGKPPRNRRFGQPEGNPNGKTSAQKKAEMKAGELAAQIQMRMLEHLSTQAPEEMAALLSGSDLVRIIKDAMDREFGTAVQKAEVSGKDGGPIQISEIRRTVVRPSEK